MHRETGLMCDHQLVFNFLQAICSGEVGRSGREPPIQKVLSGEVKFKVRGTDTRMTWPLSGHYLSALNDLQQNQSLLFAKSDGVSLRKSQLLIQWRANLKELEIDMRTKYKKYQLVWY